MLERDPSLVKQTTLYDRHSALHVAAANGQIEIIRPLSHDQRTNRNGIFFFLLVSQQTELAANKSKGQSWYPGFNLALIPDGLPEDHPRLGDQLMEMFDALEAMTKPLFREMLVSDGGGDNGGLWIVKGHFCPKNVQFADIGPPSKQF
ncbi:hypothetical protein RHMOL_Rhmol07G0029400 [Rhododendron molle]|uniref:Uncharacterized protein n=1 Tax=Rhododendron molle TaxID=49168 RepID=A0ACC0MX05_RHOML|nr:hypothetical protein RHMOL_Rhmol07G0029400 [Rhododendron molle]